MLVSGGNANKASLSIRFKNKYTYTQIGTGAYYLGVDNKLPSRDSIVQAYIAA